jgi:hypothetical protein
MALAAAQVVDALATRLTGLGLTGSRVYPSRLWPITEAELPAWRVIAEDEPVQLTSMDGINQHNLRVRCVGLVRATADADDAMHALAAQGLAALFVDPVPYGATLSGIQRSLVTEGEASLAAISLVITTQFFVRESAPETLV